MKPVVVDASVAGSWLLPDEFSEAAANLYAQARLNESPFFAPALWLWETGNLLELAVVRQRIDPSTQQACTATLRAANVQIDAVPNAHRLDQTARLAATHKLTFYDAAYLELVLRLNGQLASHDKALVNAAKSCGIMCLDF